MNAVLVAIGSTLFLSLLWGNALSRSAQRKQSSLVPITPALPRAIGIPTAYRRRNRKA
jgi:hypothetical protein